MIPKELMVKWDRETDRREIVFLADHGGGYPDALTAPGLTSEERLDILRGLGFRVAERYEMPDEAMSYEHPVPWCRLKNGLGVCLSDGFVIRRGATRKGGGRRGGTAQPVFSHTSQSPGR